MSPMPDHPSWPAELVEKAREAVKTHEWEAEDGTLELCDEIVSVVLSALSGDLVPREEQGEGRHLVWVCAGCDECEPLDGSPRSSGPCNGPSQNGAWVVEADAFDALKGQADALAEALESVITDHSPSHDPYWEKYKLALASYRSKPAPGETK